MAVRSSLMAGIVQLQYCGQGRSIPSGECRKERMLVLVPLSTMVQMTGAVGVRHTSRKVEC